MTNDNAANLFEHTMIMLGLKNNPRDVVYKEIINSQDVSVEELLAELSSSSSNRMESLLVHPVVQAAMRRFARDVLYELKRDIEEEMK